MHSKGGRGIGGELGEVVFSLLFPWGWLCLQAAVRGTDFYEGYTGVTLPLKKMDLMAIPGKRGAVENWGLIQFDERRVLFNEVSSDCCPTHQAHPPLKMCGSTKG